MTLSSGSQFIVQGASRGIGLSITERILARDPDSIVLATCRGIPSQAKALANLQEKYQNRLRLISLDVESETSVKNAASETKAVVHEVDRIINVAGVLHEEGLTPRKDFQTLPLPTSRKSCG